jgi:hypothetical protein
MIRKLIKVIVCCSVSYLLKFPPLVVDLNNSIHVEHTDTLQADDDNQVCKNHFLDLLVLSQILLPTDAHGDILLESKSNHSNPEYGSFNLPDQHDVYTVGNVDSN